MRNSAILLVTVTSSAVVTGKDSTAHQMLIACSAVFVDVLAYLYWEQ